MKKVKSLIALILSTMLTVGLLAGCGAKEEEKASSSSTKKEETQKQESQKSSEKEEEPVAEGVTYPLEGNVTLKIVSMGATINKDKPEIFESFKKATGVNVEVENVSMDQISLMISSGELPDIIVAYNNAFPAGIATAVADGTIVPLEPYLEEWAPDLYAFLESNDAIRKGSTIAGYGVVTAPNIRPDGQWETSAGLTMRADWLKDLGLDVPETADEYYEALKAFKEKKGAKAPLSVALGNLKLFVNNGLITSAFNLASAGFYQKDGQVHFGASEAEYKDVLAYLHKLYDEGLLDPDFQTIDGATATANFTGGVSGATFGAVASGISGLLQAMEEKDPNFDVTAVGSLVAQKGDKAMANRASTPLVGRGMFLTSECENIEAAVKFMNFGYSEEGIKWFNFGEEGVAHTMLDGKPIYTDLITKNPEGLTMLEALGKYTGVTGNWGYLIDRGYNEQLYQLPQQIDAIARWSNTDAQLYLLPTLEIAKDDADEYATINADITTYVGEMFVNYITGEKSLDTFETEYLPTLEKMGLKRYIEIQQNALDAYGAL